jgi:hypothetical protein
MPRVIDISNCQFGSLIAIRWIPGQGWLCRCNCGIEKTVANSTALRKGLIKSCGCERTRSISEYAKFRRPGHRMTGSPTYRSWQHMKIRCADPNAGGYARYGGRGITVCARWRESFENFLADMGERPENTTIDRVDNDRGYEPGNCRWATRLEQSRNRACNVITVATAEQIRRLNTEGCSVKEISDAFEVSMGSVRRVISGHTWSVLPQAANARDAGTDNDHRAQP